MTAASLLCAFLFGAYLSHHRQYYHGIHDLQRSRSRKYNTGLSHVPKDSMSYPSSFLPTNVPHKSSQTFISLSSSLSLHPQQRASVATGTASRATSAHTWTSWRACSRRQLLLSRQQSQCSPRQSSQAPHQPRTSGTTLQLFPFLPVRIRLFIFWGKGGAGNCLLIIFIMSCLGFVFFLSNGYRLSCLHSSHLIRDVCVYFKR